MKPSGIFITGTDTDVGKTFIGQRLVSELLKRGVPLSPRKPAESGCETIDGVLTGHDALQYFHACGGTVPLDLINPHRFKAALAPPAAAQLEGRQITLEHLVEASLHRMNGMLIVEGAGGWLSPIADNGLNADLATRVANRVIIVAADRLGCLNHILLTVEAIERRGLTVLAVVLNPINNDESSKSNGDWLEDYAAYPVIRFEQSEAQNHLAISRLADLASGA